MRSMVVGHARCFLPYLRRKTPPVPLHHPTGGPPPRSGEDRQLSVETGHLPASPPAPCTARTRSSRSARCPPTSPCPWAKNDSPSSSRSAGARTRRLISPTAAPRDRHIYLRSGGREQDCWVVLNTGVA